MTDQLEQNTKIAMIFLDLMFSPGKPAEVTSPKTPPCNCPLDGEAYNVSSRKYDVLLWPQ